jgi:disulfide bond formation protein DsbB
MKLPSERATYFIGFILTLGLLAVTFYLQKFDGFIPCPLCILQRVTFIGLGIFFFLGWTFSARKLISALFGILAFLVSLLGILLSGRQVWLQHLPPDKNADCSVSLQYLMHALPFDQVIAKIMQGTAECSQKGWEFLSLSMAEWSLIWFVAFFVLCFIQIVRTLRR